MAIPLPTLTWKQSAWSADLTGSTEAANLLAGLSTLIGASTYWQRTPGIGGNGTSDDFLEIQPKTVGAEFDKQKILIMGDALPNTRNAIDNETIITALYMNYCPDDTGASTNDPTDWKTADPYVGAATAAGGAVNSLAKFTEITKVYFLESAEAIIIVWYESDTELHVMYAGALIQPVATGVATNDRIFGYGSTGDDEWTASSVSTPLANTAGVIFGKNNYTTASDHGRFYHFSPLTETWEVVANSHGIHDSTAGEALEGDEAGPLSTGDWKGNLALLPLGMREAGGYFLGTLRQIYPGFDTGQARTVLQNAAGDDLGFVLSPKVTPGAECYIVMNS